MLLLADNKIIKMCVLLFYNLFLDKTSGRPTCRRKSPRPPANYG